MKGYLKIIIPAGIIAAIGLIIYPRYHKWAREHVSNVTATVDHPLNCASCHLYIKQPRLVAKIVNARYDSPLNLAVSNDGKYLYVITEDGNSLLVINIGKNKVSEEIQVGIHPHSVILDKPGDKAYVSNQWSDNVSVIDLKTNKVIDTVKTGGGPAGLALSSDEKSLFIVNSFTSDISVVDLSSGEEIKRLTAGNNPTGNGKSPDGSLL
jgi:YVTN family beta-propeller protein